VATKNEIDKGTKRIMSALVKMPPKPISEQRKEPKSSKPKRKKAKKRT